MHASEYEAAEGAHGHDDSPVDVTSKNTVDGEGSECAEGGNGMNETQLLSGKIEGIAQIIIESGYYCVIKMNRDVSYVKVLSYTNKCKILIITRQ